MFLIEKELYKSGTSIVSELYNLRNDYLAELNESVNSNQEELMLKLDKIDEIILRYESYNFILENEGFLQPDSVAEYSSYLFHISPNCICNWSNYLAGVPCYYCIQYQDVQEAVVAIVVGFNLRGWKLAADLLFHSMVNNVLDSDYTPAEELVNRIKQSAQILEGVAQKDALSGGYEQNNPGWLNGVFANT